MNLMDEILRHLYQLRVLSSNQIERYFFSSKSYCTNTLIRMTNKEKLIKKIKIGKESYYMITNRGIHRLKNIGSAPLGTVENEILMADEYQTERSIGMKEDKIPHQIAINEMILKFENTHYPLKWKYLDDKYANKNFVRFQPDGVLEIEDICYLIEMDMNTEDKRQLERKWQRYRNVVEQGINQKYKRIRVLFTLGTEMNYEKRKEQLYRSIQYHLAEYIQRDTFDVYTGTIEEMLKVIDEEITDEYITDVEDTFVQGSLNMNFQIEKGWKLEDRSMDFYVSIQKDGKVASVKGEHLEYIVSDFRKCQYSALSNIMFFDQITVDFQRTYGKDIKMIVLVKDETYNSMLAQLTEYENNIFLTTAKRWNEMAFPESLFRWGENKQRYHLTNDMRTMEQEES